MKVLFRSLTSSPAQSPWAGLATGRGRSSPRPTSWNTGGHAWTSGSGTGTSRDQRSYRPMRTHILLSKKTQVSSLILSNYTIYFQLCFNKLRIQFKLNKFLIKRNQNQQNNEKKRQNYHFLCYKQLGAMFHESL